MSFEKPIKQEEERSDRKLGDEWVDWDGTREQNDTRTPAGVFILLVIMVTGMFAGLGGGVLWLVAPRMRDFSGDWLVQGAAWIWFGYLGAWLFVFLLGAVSGFSVLRTLMRSLGGIRWILDPAIMMGKLFGLSRDRVVNAFILVYNRFEVLPLLIKDPLRLLLLLPRCLNRENMLKLRAMKEKYGLSQVVAFGGTEARKAIAQVRPQGIVAVACERDLMVGIKDLRGRIPVLAFAIERPEGPCKNTLVDSETIEKTIRLFLGKPA